ncbi:hypothetical protein [Antrihabitans spumae]|uniref:Uncharacterized protein n=1 Tax=Antrihabitans spumae TaxID=3373370 RepID=A0ABW7KFF5_9NOCA
MIESEARRIDSASHISTWPVTVELDNGLTVTVDPTSPNTRWSIEVRDVSTSAAVLDQLLRDRHSPAPKVGRAWPGIARLATLVWLESWFPWLLEGDALDIEIASVASEMVEIGAASIARERYSRCIGTLLDLGGRTGPGDRIDDRAQVVVRKALAGAWAFADAFDKRDRTQLQRLMSIGGQSRGGRVEPERTVDDLLLGVDLSTLVAGFRTQSGGIRARRTSVDWAVVPRGYLDPGENTVTVTTQGDEVGVSVVAAESAQNSGLWTHTLGVRVFREGSVAPAVLGRLEVDRSSGEYRGTVKCAGGLGDTDVVDVYSMGDSLPAALGRDRAIAAARRHATWAAAISRLAMLDSPEFADEALRTARTEWHAAASLAPVGSTVPEAISGPVVPPSLAEMALVGIVSP